MKNSSYDFGYGIKWKDAYVNYREGYYSSVTDFHEHDFYEINLILSGNIKILLANRAEEVTQSRIVLTRPGTPYFISCKPDALYSRLYLVFSKEFIAENSPEWNQLEQVFGESGFSDTGGLIRCFKQKYGTTPRRYLAQEAALNEFDI